MATVQWISLRILFKVRLEGKPNSLKTEFVDSVSCLLTKNAELRQRLAFSFHDLESYEGRELVD